MFATDPTKSNAGNLFAGLMANMFDDRDAVTVQTERLVQSIR